MARTIYLDHNSTTPLLPAVAVRLAEAQAENYANPASQHSEGRRARRALEAARERITNLLGGDASCFAADRLIFTSGATEANTLALRGLAGPPGGAVLISAIEHPSVSETADQMLREGYRIERIGVNAHGVVQLDELDRLLAEVPNVRLVSVMLANNETGVIQPVGEVVARCAAAGVPVHTDAVQVVGKLPVGFRALGVAALSFTAHKFHGPRGVGGLLVGASLSLTPLLHGGPQQAGLRPGTEAVDLAIGAQAALEAWYDEAAERAARLAGLQRRFETGLKNRGVPLRVWGSETDRLPHTSCLSFDGFDRQALMMALDLAGIACSTGSACASGSSEPSPTLIAMGLSAEQIRGALRFSWGALTTTAHIDRAVDRICQTINDLRLSSQRT
ncbi:cysteine desulfurase family protein [Botrimarina hoheduenensis]|uniref:Cysteine desulfurase n=1 Tax=Botrimarina hoheduenensis TaxID=2528000 RepID=A0A5C5W7H7_9BACT|nr:cysteine desulfurase family protein [Botrimarina hoheduenensis]TWT46866.1 Cysteine desulfurase [Botrimarina hoheduenensis]